MIDTTAIRKFFPHTKSTVYFNAASTGPLSTPAYEAQDRFYNVARMAGIGSQQDMFDALVHIRQLGAKVFGCRDSEAGFGFNTTYGINLAAYGLPLEKGDEVLIPDIEFPANVYPWLGLKQRGIKVTFVPSAHGFFDLDLFRKHIGKNTRALSLSFVQFFNGYKNDMKAIGDICKDHGLYFVMDAIQGAGVEPIDVHEWGVDIASAGAQKWMLSSQGSGLFYISDAMQKKLIAPWRSWLGIDWKCNWSDLNDYSRNFEPTAQQFEMGTYPSAHVFSLAWSLEFLTGLGVENIQSHTHGLLDTLIDYLKDEPYYRITSSTEEKHRSAILSFTTDKGDIRDVHRTLLKSNIVTALREGSIRVSAHVYNDADDIRQLIDALKTAIK